MSSFFSVQCSVGDSAIRLFDKRGCHRVLANLRLSLRLVLMALPIRSMSRFIPVQRDLVALVRRQLRALVVRLFSHFVGSRSWNSISIALEACVLHVLDESTLGSVLGSPVPLRKVR